MAARVEGLEKTAQKAKLKRGTGRAPRCMGIAFVTRALKALGRSGGTPQPLRQILGAAGKSTGVSFTWLNVLVNIIWM